MEVILLSELRQDIFTGEWIIFAGNRMKRPYDFIKKSVPKTFDSSECQFCPGNEKLTTEPLYQDGSNGNWTIRVFPNKYPAVSDKSDEADNEGFYRAERGFGIHEVVVDTPDHMAVLHDFSVEKIRDILKVLKARFIAISENENIKYAQIFKNCGPDAGASIMHSHWQIIGVPVIPCEQANIIKNEKKYKDEFGKCMICDIIKHESEKKIRIVYENQYFIAFAPYASKMSYECMIAVKGHIPSISGFDEEMLYCLADVIKAVLSAVKTLREGICYNLCFEDTPKGQDGHWFMKILPRMGNPAGFEYGTNSYINPILPEKAAEYMRNKIKENYRG